MTTVGSQRLKGGFQRILRYRLLIPLLRAKHPPEYTARGVLVGLLVAMTPTVGVQMPICLAIWFILRMAYPAWEFNVVIAMAWTWVTNVFTLGPIYYVFLLTGQLMLGEGGAASGYDEFMARLQETLSSDAGFIESLWVYTVDLFRIWGVPMFLGSIPWALLSGFIGYRWSLKFLQGVRTRRLRKRMNKKATRAAGETL